MVILKYELKRHRKYILGWAIALALCVFVMTPTYYSFMDVSTGDLYETLGTSDFYKGVGAVSYTHLSALFQCWQFVLQKHGSGLKAPAVSGLFSFGPPALFDPKRLNRQSA